MKTVNNGKIGSYLGFAVKSGNCEIGDMACERALRGGKARVILVHSEAGENTVKKFNKLCEQTQIPFYRIEGLSLYEAIGKDGCRVIAVTDKQLAGAMIKQLKLKNATSEVQA